MTTPNRSIAARFALIGACALLMSCDREDAAIIEEDAAALEMGVAVAVDKAASAHRPKACDDYLGRVEACLTRIDDPRSASLLAEALDRASSQWAHAPDLRALASSCRAADERFTDTATTVGCE